MVGKTLFIIMLLAGVAVVPYFLSDEEWLVKVERLISGESISEQPPASDSSVAAAPNQKAVEGTTTRNVGMNGSSFPWQSRKPTTDPFASPANFAGTVVAAPKFELPLPHLLNFQATPEWITENWGRVSNRIGELDLQGWRVPYFRNQTDDDFAGSVTYYFDRARRVQRIMLHGYTSDASELVQIATGHYGMRRIHCLEGDVYLAQVDGRTVGGLKLDYAPVLNSQRKEKQCEVLLELNRRNTEYGMSYEFTKLIRQNAEKNSLLTPLPPSPFG